MKDFIEMITRMRLAQKNTEKCTCKGCRDFKILCEHEVDKILKYYRIAITDALVNDELESIKLKDQILYFPARSKN